jgi:hypothetical protein
VRSIVNNAGSHPEYAWNISNSNKNLSMHNFDVGKEVSILFVFDGKETEKYFWDQTAEDEIRLSLVKYDELFVQDALICQLLYVFKKLLKMILIMKKII